MALISRSDFIEGQVPAASLWNSNFNTAYTEINGNLNAANLASAAVTKEKLNTMEYVASFTYTLPLSASAENLRQVFWPYTSTLTKIELIAGHQSTAFGVDIGLAVMNASSIGSSFFAAGSANVTASGSVLSITGASLANTTITANSKILLSVKSISTNAGQPLLCNLFFDV